MTPASIIPVFGSQRPYADLNFAGGSFGLDGRSVSDLTALPGFTFTRASLAMGYDAMGKLTYGPNNLFVRSEDCGHPAWLNVIGGTGVTPTKTSNYATAPDGTTTAARWQLSLGGGTSASDLSTVGQSVAGIVRSSCVNAFWLRTNDGSTQTVFMQAGSVNATRTVTGTWAQYVIAGTNTGSGDTCIVGLKGGQASPCPNTLDLLVWHPQIEAVTYQTTPSTYYPTTTAAYYGPRLVYDPVTLASQGILVEEARTNLCLQSQAFDSATWTKQGGTTTVTANATTSPDGTANADLFTEGASGVLATSCYQSITGAAGAYTWSVFFKAGSGSTRFLRLVIASSASDFGYMTVNMSTGAITQAAGVIGTATAASGDVTTLTGGWYRARLTTTLAAAPTIQFFVPLASGTAGVVAGDYGRDTYTANGSTWSLWQAQFEAGTGASSPIPTTTASVTRAADDARLTGLTFGTGYSVVASWQENFDDAAGFRCVLSISSAALTRESALYQRHTNNTVRIFSTGDMDLTIGTGNALTANTAAARFVTNDSTGSLNGAAAVAADTSTAPVASADRVFIGSQYAGGGNYLEGTISRIRIYNRALPDAQLQSLTT